MKKMTPAIMSIFVISLTFQGCTQKTGTDGQVEGPTSEKNIGDLAKKGVRNASTDQLAKAAQSKDAATLALMSTKLAVCSGKSQDKQDAVQMIKSAEDFAKQAEESIVSANAALSNTSGDNAQNAATLAALASSMLGDARKAAENSANSTFEPGTPAAQELAMVAQRTMARAVKATIDVNKAAEIVAGKMGGDEKD